MERIINNVQAYLFMALGIAALAGIIVKGAYWHIWTVAICYVMYKALYIPKKKEGE